MDRAPESSMSPQALPRSLVAEIFQAMQGEYGTRFLNMWRTGQIVEGGEHHGKDAGLLNAMIRWGQRLAGFADRPDCIRRVLDALPADPPTLPAFCDLCRDAARRTPSAQAALPFKADPEKAKEASNRLMAQLSGKAGDYDPLLWAKRPKSQKSMDAVIDGAKRSLALAVILTDLRSAGICNEAGKLLKRYKGQGQWVTA